MSLPIKNQPDFTLETVHVDDLGFADACRWVLRDIGAANSPSPGGQSHLMQEGQRLKITKAVVEERQTRPPRFVQEHELIRLMDENRIGTDASMAVHVSNIVDRGYVILCDETGQPLRPPGPPGQRKHNRPRQIGRYMVPTSLGIGLLELFGHTKTNSDHESPAMLSHPSIRRQMEEEVRQVATRKIEKKDCLENNLRWFEERYAELDRSLTRDRTAAFGRKLKPTREHLRYLQTLNSFEPKVPTSNNQQPGRRAKSYKKSDYGGRGGGGRGGGGRGGGGRGRGGRGGKGRGNGRTKIQ